mgnify:CR=1 FL=1|jgi:hypothetical protein
MENNPINLNIEIEDIEIEEGNDNIEISVPFNPEEINIKIIPRNIGQLVELLEDNQILIPKYQRLPNLWNNTKKSRFIESLMLDLPIPLFYFDESDSKKWFVVDGLQRMSTLEHFILGKGEVGNNKEFLRLQNLEFLTEYNDTVWNDLPKDIKRRINSNQVTINLIGRGTPDEVKYTIFSRINQGDVPLTAQEIRTALFQGYKIEFLERLVSKETEIGKLFHKTTNGSIKSKRQEDLDFASRFVSFFIQDYKTYEPDMDRFITTGTKLIPTSQVEQNNIEEKFKMALELSIYLFGNDSFRKRVSMNDGRKPINKPLFEIITTAFAHLTNEQIKIIKSKKDEFIYKFIDLQKTNQRFWNSITTGTAVKENVILRNNTFRDFLNQLI